jgi:hypothetical protein
MQDAPPAPPRVIVYVFASSLLTGQEDDGLITDVGLICAEEGVQLIDIIVDRGPPGQRREDYPVLARLQRGAADLLLIVRSPYYRRGATPDLLESCAAEGPFCWLTLDDLRRAELLPAHPRRRARVPVKSRARALRAQGLDLRKIGHTLATEGYVPGEGGRWTAARVAELLGLSLMQGGLPARSSTSASARGKARARERPGAEPPR